MSPKLISGVLLFLLLLIQYPLWFGKGGLLRVKELEGQLKEQATINDSLRLRNQQLQGDVGSLADGVEAIEERARQDFGMVKEGETLIQLVDPKVIQNTVVNAPVGVAPAPKPSGSTPKKPH